MSAPQIVHLDLFSGTGGFALGLKQAGFNVVKHYFSEIDKHAIANYKYNFKDAEYVGSVTDVRGSELTRPNIITFGSPCQDFSLAGKRKGLEGQRSGLILEAIRLISETRPDIFIWENVKGTFSSNQGRDFQAILREFANIGGYRLEWQLLNTSWLLPQNRERIYLIGHLGNRGGRNVFPFGEDDFVPNVQKGTGTGRPQTKLSTSVRPDMGSKGDSRFVEVPNKAGCLSGGGHSGGLHSDMTVIKVKSATNAGFEEATEGDSINLAQPNSETRRGRVGKAKAQTLETSCNQGVMLLNPLTDGKQTYQQDRIYDEKGLSPFLDGKAGVWGVKTEVRPVLTPERTEKRQNGRRFKEDGEPSFKLGCQDQHGVAIGARIRRLTEIECERLQGFPDNWTKHGINPKGQTIEISRTQRYKLCGNAVTASIVEMIAKRLLPTFTEGGN